VSIGTVLLAEDDTAIAEPLSRALQREGYEVAVVADGPTALRRAVDRGARVILVHATNRSRLRMAAGMDHVVEGPKGTQVEGESGADVGEGGLRGGLGAPDAEWVRRVALELGGDGRVVAAPARAAQVREDAAAALDQYT